MGRNKLTEVIDTTTGAVVVELRTPLGHHVLDPTLLPDGSGLIGTLAPTNTVVRYNFVPHTERSGPKDLVNEPRTIPVVPLELLQQPYPKTDTAPSIQGWRRKGADLPLAITNSSNETALFPDTKGAQVPAHGLAVQPSANEFVAVVWKSPVSASVGLQAMLTHRDRGGNPVAWWLEHRSGDRAVVFAEGSLEPGRTTRYAGATPKLQKGDSIILAVEAKEGSFLRTVTELALTLTEGDKANPGRVWDLVADVADVISEGNPHADKHGNKDSWSFVCNATELAPKPKVFPKDPTPTGPPDLKSRWTAILNDSKATNRVQLLPEAKLVLLFEPQAMFPPLDYHTGQPRKEFSNLVQTDSTVVFALDRGRVATLAPASDEFQLWDANGKEAGKVSIPDIPAGSGNAKRLRVTLSPDGRYIAVGRAGTPAGDNPDVPFRVFDAATGKPIISTTWKGGTPMFASDSARVCVAEWAGRVRWFKLPSGEADGGFDLGAPPGGRRHLFDGMSADGSVIAYRGPAETKDDQMMPGILDGKTGRLTRQFQKHSAVSAMTTSQPRARPAVTASKVTAAGSPPCWLTTSTWLRPAHTASCSRAAARKVSAAASSTLQPASARWRVSLPMVVVLPAPLTPVTMITVGLAAPIISGFCSGSSRSVMASASSAFTAAGSVALLSLTRRLRSSSSCCVAATPASAISSADSRSS